MTLPDIQACPNCGRSIQVRPKTCPGCGYVIRAYRVRVNDRVIERVVAIPPEHADKFKTVADVEELKTGPGGLTEDPTNMGS